MQPCLCHADPPHSTTFLTATLAGTRKRPACEVRVRGQRLSDNGGVNRASVGAAGSGGRVGGNGERSSTRPGAPTKRAFLEVGLGAIHTL